MSRCGRDNPGSTPGVDISFIGVFKQNLSVGWFTGRFGSRFDL